MADKIYRFIIIGKPMSVNQTYKVGRGRYRGRLYVSEEAKNYGQFSSAQVRQQMRVYNLFSPLSSQYLEAWYVYYFNSHRKFDHLNCNKKLNDALNQILWFDDKQIKVSHHYSLIDLTKPRIELFVREITDIQLPEVITEYENIRIT